MKTITLAVIGSGVLCLIVAFVETLIQVYLLKVHPMSLIVLASSLFLLAIALMCHARFFGTKSEQN